MKKVLYLFAILIAIAFCNVGCGNDEGILMKNEKEEYFQDLEELRNCQLGFTNALTRSGNEISDSDRINLIKKLDENAKNFVIEHKEILKRYVTDTLSQDSIMLLSLDEDDMRDYLSATFSEEFVDAFYGALNSNTVNNSTLNELNPLESFLIVNAETYNSLTDIFPDSYAEPGNKDKTKKQKECLANYNRQTHECNLASGFIEVIGIGTLFIVSVCTGGVGTPAGAAGETIFSLEACLVRIICLRNAENEYNNCINGKNK